MSYQINVAFIKFNQIVFLLVQNILGNEMDTGALFEKYTIEEIRDIEKRTR